MAMRELLRVTMSAAQIREALIAWTMGRTNMTHENADFDVEGIDNALKAEIVARKKRNRTTNGEGKHEPSE